MGELSRTLQDMPLAALIPVGLLMVVGGMLWLAGTRILRFAFAAVGAILGGCLGWIVGETFGLGVLTWALAGVGAIVLALVAAVAFRFTVAAAMATLLAFAAPLVTITVAEIQAARAKQPFSESTVVNPLAEKIQQGVQKLDQPELRNQVADSIKSMRDSLAQASEHAKETPLLDGQLAENLEEVRRFSARLFDAVREKWGQTPESLRPTLIISAVLGAIIGFLLGLIAQTISAAALTALGGSLLCLAGMQILAARTGFGESWLPSTAMGWLILWLITSALGVVIQWTFRKRRADKAG